MDIVIGTPVTQWLYLCGMRVVKQIPHSHLKITVYQWNDKYIVELEIDRYKQSFKLNQSDVSGIDQIEAMLTPKFLNEAMGRFVQMRSDWTEQHKTVLK